VKSFQLSQLCYSWSHVWHHCKESDGMSCTWGINFGSSFWSDILEAGYCVKWVLGEMEKGWFHLLRLWRVLLLWGTACTIMLLRCVLSLNEEGNLLLNSKQDYLEYVNDSMSNWNASDTTPCFWNGVKCTEGSVSVLDLSSTPFRNLVGNIHALAFS